MRASQIVPLVTRRHTLPLAGVAADWRALPLNGDLLSIRGLRRFDVPVSLYGTSYWGELEPSLLQLLGFLLAPTGRLVFRPRILQGMSVAEFESEGHKTQDLALSAAALAAGEFLGLPGSVTGSGCHVDGVDTSRSLGLSVGDVITQVDGKDVTTLVEFLAVMEEKTSASLRITPALRTGGDPRPRSVLLERNKQGHFGLKISTHQQHITPGIDAEMAFPPDGGGSSCGLMLALALLDVLTPGSLTGGTQVSGTGSLGPDGSVLPIGGAGMKVRTARTEGHAAFLCPRENEAEARKSASGRVEIVGVSTLEEAVGALVERGGTFPILQRS